jgi:hypothetical protein
MKLTIYARTTEQLNQFVETFQAMHKTVNFIDKRDTWSMSREYTIPWRDGHHQPNQADPSRYEFYRFIEIT